jgi:predicted transcriptional regulator
MEATKTAVKKELVSARVPREIRQQLNNVAASLGQDRSFVINQALVKYLSGQ